MFWKKKAKRNDQDRMICDLLKQIDRVQTNNVQGAIITRTGPSTSIDLNFRPATYWDEPTRRIANITGTVRRRRAKEIVSTGNTLPDELVADSTEADKNALGRMNPRLRSGEDLKPVRTRETEI